MQKFNAFDVSRREFRNLRRRNRHGRAALSLRIRRRPQHETSRSHRPRFHGDFRNINRRRGSIVHALTPRAHVRFLVSHARRERSFALVPRFRRRLRRQRLRRQQTLKRHVRGVGVDWRRRIEHPGREGCLRALRRPRVDRRAVRAASVFFGVFNLDRFEKVKV